MREFPKIGNGCWISQKFIVPLTEARGTLVKNILIMRYLSVEVVFEEVVKLGFVRLVGGVLSVLPLVGGCPWKTNARVRSTKIDCFC